MRKSFRRAVRTVVVLSSIGTCTSLPTANAAERIPVAAVILGGGNSMGWLGGQVEYYFANGRASVLAGVGYVPKDSEKPTLPTGVAGAGAVRVFTAVGRHRSFLEVSVSELRREATVTMVGPTVVGLNQKHLYGPGFQLGYQHVSTGGFTFLASAGVGFPLGSETNTSAAFMGGLGMGYTWRHK